MYVGDHVVGLGMVECLLALDTSAGWPCSKMEGFVYFFHSVSSGEILEILM